MIYQALCKNQKFLSWRNTNKRSEKQMKFLIHMTTRQCGSAESSSSVWLCFTCGSPSMRRMARMIFAHRYAGALTSLTSWKFTVILSMIRWVMPVVITLISANYSYHRAPIKFDGKKTEKCLSLRQIAAAHTKLHLFESYARLMCSQTFFFSINKCLLTFSITIKHDNWIELRSFASWEMMNVNEIIAFD